jgi:hypothetical protein
MGTRRKPLIEHGINGYVHYGCRCEICTAANTARIAAARARRLARPVPSRVHGTLNGYNNYGCRCERCTEAHSADLRDRRAKRTR